MARVRIGWEVTRGEQRRLVLFLDYEDSHHGPLLCVFQLLYCICVYCLMMYLRKILTHLNLLSIHLKWKSV